jgi:hypothetical protein
MEYLYSLPLLALLPSTERASKEVTMRRVETMRSSIDCSEEEVCIAQCALEWKKTRLLISLLKLRERKAAVALSMVARVSKAFVYSAERGRE